jgi:hypothetical protein
LNHDHDRGYRAVMRISIAKSWDGNAIPDGEIAHLDARIEGDDLVVLVDAPFGGDPPPPVPVGGVWKLWENEVLELFLLGEDGHHYLEIEVGPYGHHLVLQLEGVRNIVRAPIPIQYVARRRDRRWTGEARMPRTLLPAGPFRANAYRHQGGKFYAASPVGPERDFHQLERFVPFDLER